MPTYLLATQKLMNIKKKKKNKKNKKTKSKHDFRVLAILDKLQSTIRYQLPWLKIYNIWLLLSSLFDVSSAMCGRNQREERGGGRGLLYLGMLTLWQFFFFFLMAKEGGQIIVTHPLGVTIGAPMLENVELSHNYCGQDWP